MNKIKTKPITKEEIARSIAKEYKEILQNVEESTALDLIEDSINDYIAGESTALDL